MKGGSHNWQSGEKGRPRVGGGRVTLRGDSRAQPNLYGEVLGGGESSG